MTVRTVAGPVTERKLFCREKDRERGTFCVEKEVLFLTTVYVVWVMSEIPVRGVSGIIRTGANRRTWRKICTSATLSTMNPSTDCSGVVIGYSW